MVAAHANARRSGDRLSFRAEPRNAFADAHDAVCGHLRPRNFLDLPGRAGSVVDKNALTQSQIDDVLLARDLFGDRGRCQHPQAEAAGQRNQHRA